MELGVPFSDPLADGPTVQKTSFQALENGVNVKTCLDAIRRIRSRGVEVPLVLFGYYNPFLRYGTEAFAQDAAEAGADGSSCRTCPSRRRGRPGEMQEPWPVPDAATSPHEPRRAHRTGLQRHRRVYILR